MPIALPVPGAHRKRRRVVPGAGARRTPGARGGQASTGAATPTAAATATATAKKLAPGTRPPTGRGTRRAARYVGAAGSRPYQIYLPAGLRRNSKVPLVILLHGCRQTPAEFAASTRFNQLADQSKFIAVYPEQTVANNLQRCWNWFDAAHQGRGQGEPAILAGIARQVMAERTRWRIDPERVYVVGLSAGGAMALVLGATYPDLFAAIGVHSAPPYRSTSNRLGALGAMAGRSRLPTPTSTQRGIAPMVVFQGGVDYVVRSVNATRITDQWLQFHELSVSGERDPARITRTREVARTASRDRKYTVTAWYGANGRKLLESWQVARLAHAWSGGTKGLAFSDPQGPRATSEMWKFLSGHHLTNR